MQQYSIPECPGYYFTMRPSVEENGDQRILLYKRLPAPGPDLWITNQLMQPAETTLSIIRRLRNYLIDNHYIELKNHATHYNDTRNTDDLVRRLHGGALAAAYHPVG
jgi:hypothetical protein